MLRRGVIFTPSGILMRAFQLLNQRCPAGWLFLLALLLPVIPLTAQRPGTGDLVGRVVDDRDIAVPDATLTLSRSGIAMPFQLADVSGRFQVSNLPPGNYTLLVEQVGYQPVRILGLEVVGGARLRLTVRLERRPPPITSVEERIYDGAGAVAEGGVLTGEEITAFSRRFAATDLTSGSSAMTTPFDGRGGFSGNGMPTAASVLIVDGLEESLLRHPGLPAEGGSAPLFARRGVSQARTMGFVTDAESPAAQGASLFLLPDAGAGVAGIRPWVSWSGAAMAAAEDNPADSSGSTLAVGVDVSGGNPETTSWSLSGAMERRREPGADLSTTDPAAFVEAIADASSVGGFSLEDGLFPTVHGWEGVTGSGALQSRLGKNSRITARFAAAAWDEDAPRLWSPAAGEGSKLTANDVSGAVAYEISGEGWGSVTRLGIRSSSREWTGSGLGEVNLVSAGLALGSAASLPGDFSERTLQIGEVVSFPTGNHNIKLGGLVAKRTVNYDWVANGGGALWFGSTDDIEARRFSLVAVPTAGTAPDLDITEFAGFVEDEWSVSPEFTLTGGVRYQGQRLPDEAFTISGALATRLGINNALVPTGYASAVGPRLALSWHPRGSDQTVFTVAGGLVPGRYDLSAFAEAARYDGGVIVERFAGTSAGAVGHGGSGVTGVSAAAYTFFGDQVRAPRSSVFDASLRQVLAPGTVVTVSGGYRHGDYQLRRSDYNRPAAPLAFDGDDRAIWGVLDQFDGLVVAAPGSNRRFAEFDHVWGLASTGYVDHYEATASIERRVGDGFSLSAAYTWSQTEDNLVGQLSADPADRATPVGAAFDGSDWSDGRSDLDIPGRAVASIRYDAPGSGGVSIAARWRWRSGLPFTPGYRDGVDANGDGSVRNDPVALGSVAGLPDLLNSAGCTAGAGKFAERNSCREDAVHALDVHLGFRLPVGGGRLRITVDAFNLVASDVGFIDRAAVLVDPDGSITTDSAGRLSLPLLLNDNFGQLLARRNDPRTIRFGLALEN